MCPNGVTNGGNGVAVIVDDMNDPEKPSWRTSAPQILATMAQSMLLLSLGMFVAAPTMVIGALHNSTGKLSMTSQEASWFAGLLLINQPVGSLLSGFVQDFLGRKKCMILVNVPQVAAWILLFTAQSMTAIYVAAVMMGFSCGFLEAPSFSYVGEVCQPHLRGRMASLTGVFVASGTLLIYLLGAVTDWRTLSAISTSVPILTAICIFQVPESPVWLVMNGRDDEAKKALAWLRGWVSTESIVKEFECLKDHIRSRHHEKVIHNRGSEYEPVPITESGAPAVVQKSGWRETISCLAKPEMSRPLKMTVSFFFFYHCAAFNGSRPYLVVIFKQLHTEVDPFVGPVMAVVCLIMGTITCIICIRKVGKRKLSLISIICCSLITCSIGVYAYLHKNEGLTIPLFPEMMFSCLYFFSNLGIGVIPWVLLSEVFPARGRGLGGGISAASYYVFWFLASKTFLYLESYISLSGVCFFYSAIGGIAGTSFVYFCLPETEGKTLVEVEAIFKTRELKPMKKSTNNH